MDRVRRAPHPQRSVHAIDELYPWPVLEVASAPQGGASSWPGAACHRSLFRSVAGVGSSKGSPFALAASRRSFHGEALPSGVSLGRALFAALFVALFADLSHGLFFALYPLFREGVQVPFLSMYLAATMASLPPSAVASDNTAAAAPVTPVWAMMTVALCSVFSTRVSW